MAQDVAQLTGINVHAQVYLLTDFWDALKDAHPVMFTFLRDGVPFYDRGLYNSWKELLKLGKILVLIKCKSMFFNHEYGVLQYIKIFPSKHIRANMSLGFECFVKPENQILGSPFFVFGL